MTATNPLFLSRLILNPRSRQVVSEMAHPYEMHRTLMRAFPSAEEGGPGRALFRVDTFGQSGDMMVLVQSQTLPNWSHLRCGDYLAGVPGIQNPACKSLSFAPSTGQLLRFRLRANPTVKTGGKRMALWDTEKQLAWLRRKAEVGGFAIANATVIPEGKVKASRGRGEAEMVFAAARFDGILRVTDPEKLRETVEGGIGSGKGMGFGLLSLGRA